MTTKRHFMIGLASTALAARTGAFAAEGGPFGGEGFRRAVLAAEAQGGGRLGVTLLDTQTGQRFSWRGEERFALCSTFKCVLTAAILIQVDRGDIELSRNLPIAASDLVEYAPVVEKHVGADGLTIAALCEATMVWSDNAAANLLLPLVGGPEGLTRFARAWGDPQFRLDRIETALGEAKPGDLRDTTTPDAMVDTLERLLLGNVLSAASRMRLSAWLAACRTGNDKIRAGLPRDWRVGDKTGAGGYGSTHDIAILWPPGRSPILVAVYLTETAAPLAARNAALASVGPAITKAAAK